MMSSSTAGPGGFFSHGLPARSFLIWGSLLLLTACGATIDYKRVTYDFLRQADCRQNDINEFCDRTFVFEYDEYEKIRREFLRIEAEKFADHMSATERYQALHPNF